jgi:hypothetical protein
MDTFTIYDNRIPYFYVTYVETGLNLDLEALGITADTWSTGTIDIEATVTETLVSKNKKKTVDQVTKCSLKEVPVYY